MSKLMNILFGIESRKDEEGDLKQLQNSVELNTPPEENINALSDTSTESLVFKTKSLFEIYENCTL